QYTAVYAGAHKNDLSPHEPLSDPARAMLQAEVDRVYELFVTTVAKMRRMDPVAVKATEASLYFGDDALAAGLADKRGTYGDALSALTAS
ncbi:S49 family peptidase, partial [Vibrio parahaemolyticus]